MALRGAANTAIFDAVKAAVTGKRLPELEPGSMAYMMSKRQYLADPDPASGIVSPSWHPHVMFYAPRSDAANLGASFGANLKGSPIIFDTAGGVPDPWTVFFVPVWRWSDGSPGPLLTMHATARR